MLAADRRRRPVRRGGGGSDRRRDDRGSAAATLACAEIADLDGVERPVARTGGIGDGDGRRRARGREDADDGAAVGVVHGVVRPVDVDGRRAVRRNGRAVGRPVRNELDEVGVTGRQSRERERERERSFRPFPVPAVRFHLDIE